MTTKQTHTDVAVGVAKVSAWKNRIQLFWGEAMRSRGQRNATLCVFAQLSLVWRNGLDERRHSKLPVGAGLFKKVFYSA